ncbi:SDR family NAD(P)-dependent oxidoreductase [Pelagibius sp.]|uniref:SDR family NAD(P)-dependent oxidoreductase n=1 Tax=Pelagibius sp. TaxID=1931238 RepID=UPI003B506BDD
MTGSMNGKVALVTGASSGIGQAIAAALAKEGVKTVISGRSVQGLSETASRVKAAGGEVHAIEADLMDPASVELLVTDGAAAFDRLDYVVNNAGTQGEVNVVADQRLESYEEVFATNVRAPFLIMKYAIPHLLRQGGGAIVNLASGGGLVGVPGASVYCASKHAVMGLTKVAAIDYAKQGIRVNAVNPGGVDTPMLRKFFESIPGDDARAAARAAFEATHPIGRLATAEEIADAVVFLCSPKASNIVGIALSVDGGYVAN